MITAKDIEALVSARHCDPFAHLGIHSTPEGWVVRTFRPDASRVEVEDLHSGARHPARRIHPEGLYESRVPERISYRWVVTDSQGLTQSELDPYALGSTLGELDFHLLGEGQHWRMYDRLGAHLSRAGDVDGVVFAVWAPNAARVSVVGDFNQWDGRRHPMRLHPANGIWEIFLPGIQSGAHYKFEIRTREGHILLKCDPLAFYGQHSLQTASMVYDLDRYVWSDDAWIQRRSETNWQKEAVSIYEVHIGSWARVPEEEDRWLTYAELADRLVPYVKEMGFTHVELMPVAEHPFDGSWGYQITGYYAPTSRFGSPDDFRAFVDRCHEAGIGVILDWVPGHFPRDAHGLARFDGTCLYEHEDPRQGEHRDWGTLIFNYGRAEVRNFLISNALFWLEQYHIDGLRVDAVASMLYLDYSRSAGDWVPNQWGGRENVEAIDFLRRFNELCYDRFPGVITIAEESTAWPMVSRPTYLGGLGFGFKWNMGWMNDSLFYIGREPIHRKFHHGNITFSLLYAFHEHFILVLSHDEVVHGKGSLLAKMPGDTWQQFANARMYLAWMWAHPGKKLLFMGAEIGQWNEWRHDASLEWNLLEYPLHRGLRDLVKELNRLLTSEPALYERDDSHEGFEWIDFTDSEASVVSFVRKASKGDDILFVVNATPVVRQHYRVGAPKPGFYQEILNTDSHIFGGGNVGNGGGIHTDAVAWNGREHSLDITIPPLATIAFRRVSEA